MQMQPNMAAPARDGINPHHPLPGSISICPTEFLSWHSLGLGQKKPQAAIGT